MKKLLRQWLGVQAEWEYLYNKTNYLDDRIKKFESKDIAPLIIENEDLKRQIKELEYRLKRKGWEVQYLNSNGLKIDFSAFFRAMDEHDLIKGLKK